MSDLRQIASNMALTGRVRMSQQVLELLTEEGVETYGALCALAERCGVTVNVGDTPDFLLEEIIAADQYAQFH